MNNFRGNIDHWLNQSEPDYYLFFLKAWIPFNAWYVAELPQYNKSDTKIIKELQNDNNSKPRQILETLISNNDSHSKKFKSYLANLHLCLESKSVVHNGFKLTFTNLKLDGDNPMTFERDTDKLENVYKAEKKTGHYHILIVAKNGRTLLDCKPSTFDIEELKRHDHYIRLSNDKMRTKILKCYEAINPQKPISLLSNSKNRSEYLLLEDDNKVKFINDPTIIAKSCIKILYALRCMLFHGEIEPTNSNKPIYENAYYLLRFIIKELH
jgi:hypothetical protein